MIDSQFKNINNFKFRISFFFTFLQMVVDDYAATYYALTRLNDVYIHVAQNGPVEFLASCFVRNVIIVNLVYQNMFTLIKYIFYDFPKNWLNSYNLFSLSFYLMILLFLLHLVFLNQISCNMYKVVLKNHLFCIVVTLVI